MDLYIKHKQQFLFQQFHLNTSLILGLMEIITVSYAKYFPNVIQGTEAVADLGVRVFTVFYINGEFKLIPKNI